MNAPAQLELPGYPQPGAAIGTPERQRREEVKRDRKLDQLQEARADLIDLGSVLAELQCRVEPFTTSGVRVRAGMRDKGYGPLMDRKINGEPIDPRWMGAVFRKGKVFVPDGYEQTGSHGRPVRIWKLRK